MKIEVNGSPALHVARLRAYAEYRVFSQLAAFAPQVESVRVVLRRARAEGPISCRISAELKHGRRIRAQSRGSQPTRVVDSAVRKIAEVMRARL